MPMTVTFYDVGHGNCTMIDLPNGRRIMIDCGHSQSRPWYPSTAFAGQEIELLIVSNFDEDHMSDYPDVENYCDINWYRTNPTVSADDLPVIKHPDPLGRGIQALADTMSDFRPGTVLGGPDSGDVVRTYYWNSYPQDFSDSNNLSVVTFLSYAGHKFIFPGDMETAGWQKLLENQAFRNDLQDVTVFVASHHGRKTGCCEDVFEYCQNAQIAVMSDRNKSFDSQETGPWYANRMRGMNYRGQRRFVFTTRSDGDITIQVDADGSGTVDTTRGN